MNTKIAVFISFAFSFFVLSGCGSSLRVSTGVYKDAGPVGGLQYQTQTQSGVTDANGHFKYIDGEKVTFSVSNVTLGQVAGAPVVTTFDLVGIAPPTSNFGIPLNNAKSNQFQEAVNISIFLQTLDNDGDHSNGIIIPSVVNSVVAAYPINFKYTYVKDYYSYVRPIFTETYQLKFFIANCRAAGAWGGVKPIKNLGYATRNLYSGLGLVAEVYLKKVVTNPDGSTETYGYDSLGQLSDRVIRDADGKLNNRQNFTYDDNGNLTKLVVLDATDSQIYLMNYGFDANGALVSYESTFESNTNYHLKSIFTVDANGNPLLQMDYYGDRYYGKTVHKYNGHGLLESSKAYDLNDNIHSADIFSFNENLTLKSRLSSGNFGTPDEYSFRYEYEYDGYGRVTRFTQSSSTSSISYRTTFDVQGNFASLSIYSDGNLLSREVYTSDENGYRINTQAYNSENRLLSTTVYSYDRYGNLIKKSLDNGTNAYTTTYINQSGWSSLFGTLYDSPI